MKPSSRFPHSARHQYFCVSVLWFHLSTQNLGVGACRVCVCVGGGGGAGGRLIKVLPHFAPCEFNKVGGGGVHLMEGGARNNGPSAKGNWRRGK